LPEPSAPGIVFRAKPGTQKTLEKAKRAAKAGKSIWKRTVKAALQEKLDH